MHEQNENINERNFFKMKNQIEILELNTINGLKNSLEDQQWLDQVEKRIYDSKIGLLKWLRGAKMWKWREPKERMGHHQVENARYRRSEKEERKEHKAYLKISWPKPSYIWEEKWEYKFKKLKTLY